MPTIDEGKATSRSVAPGGKLAADSGFILSKLARSTFMFSRRLSSSIGLEVISPSGKVDITPFVIGMVDEIADETSGIIFNAAVDIGILLCRLSNDISGTIGSARGAGALRGCYCE